MSKVLTVPTHFNDIGELSEGFLDRVEQDILILYGPVAYEDGAEIEFAVLLADGTTALQGEGIVRAAIDGGEERVPETRYDVVIEQLQLDGRSEVVFERLILARQAVSERPPVEEETFEPSEAMFDGASEAQEQQEQTEQPEELEATFDEESAPETEPPEARAEEEAFETEADEELEPATVVAAVDGEAVVSDSFAPDSFDEASVEDEPSFEQQFLMQQSDDSSVDAFEDEGEEEGSEPAPEQSVRLDSMYAFDHGIAAEPRVGMPVPLPSMAAPPDAPPSPPVLRLAEPPQGLTRPSFAQPEEALFTADDEVSDVHTTGLFAYEDTLPIPSRPPLPDPNRPRRAVAVEAIDAYDVEGEDALDVVEYEEIRLSELAGTAEEG